MGSLSWSPLPPLCIQFCNTHPTSLASFFCCCCCFGFRRTFGTGWRSSKGEWHERSRLCKCVCKRERLRKREREKEFKRAGAQRHWWTTRSLDILTLVSTSTSLSAFISLFNISIVHGASLWKPVPLCGTGAEKSCCRNTFVNATKIMRRYRLPGSFLAQKHPQTYLYLPM